jgi:predicted nucleotidyltransferase|tara:strand:- start:2642 stop:2944 length:303 start_codon:yes stop_codon:yes gene_type:complete
MNFGLDQNVITKIHQIFAKFQKIDQVIIYGSRAIGNHKNGSDIDLALIGCSLNFNYQCKIEVELDKLMIPHSFDIAIYDQIDNQNLIDHIQKYGKIFYKL